MSDETQKTIIEKRETVEHQILDRLIDLSRNSAADASQANIWAQSYLHFAQGVDTHFEGAD